MDLTEETIRKLSNDELVQRLVSCGERTGGPLTPSTRSIYEKRLLKRIMLDSAAACKIVYNIDKEDTIRDLTSNITGSGDDRNQSLLNNRLPDLAAEKNLQNNPVIITNNSTPEASETKPECGPFYAVRALSPAVSRVFTSKADALKHVKENPGSRFNRFDFRSDADMFCSSLPAENTQAAVIDQTQQSSPGATKAVVPPSEGSAFKGVKMQDFVILRKAIECGDVETVKSLVWSNPRYLIGSGDTPTVLQEGFRYNALHVCAQKNQAAVCQLILDTIEDPMFMRLMYPDNTDELNIWNRIEFLSDLYLNTPDKGNYESPLHFACKFGHLEVITVLARHPKIDRHVKNKFGETPLDVLCSRISKPSAVLKEKIRALLENQYYVRLLRSDDNVTKITHPWCPSISCDEHDIEPISRADLASMKTGSNVGSPREAPMTVKAYAGPMSPAQAEDFRKMWISSPRNATRENIAKYKLLKRTDVNKGLERIGRDLCSTMAVPWCEYWSFLDAYVDIRSSTGLSRLEAYLKEQHEILEAEEQLRKTKLQVLLEQEQQLRKNDDDFCSLFGQLKLETERGQLDNNFSNGSRHDITADLADLRMTPPNDPDKSTAHNEDDRFTSDVDDTNSVDSFVTAADDLDLDYSDTSDVMDETWSINNPSKSSPTLFLHGAQPTRTDLDVFRALEIVESVNLSNYPLIAMWKNSVQLYSEEERIHWPAPHRVVGSPTSTPWQCERTPTRTMHNISGDADSSEGVRSFSSNTSSDSDDSVTPDRQYLYRTRLVMDD